MVDCFVLLVFCRDRDILNLLEFKDDKGYKMCLFVFKRLLVVLCEKEEDFVNLFDVNLCKFFFFFNNIIIIV